MPRARRRSFPIPTPDSLAHAALHYLSRYATSEASLRRMLLTKLRRTAMAHPDFAADQDRQAALRLQIEGIIAKHRASGALNDKAFADMKVASLRRAGRSRHVIRQKLSQKGVPDTLISQSLEQHAQDSVRDGSTDDTAREQDEWLAAMAFARKRRLGPFRAAGPSAREREEAQEPAEARTRQSMRAHREVAAFARAGFAPALAYKILGLAPEDIGDADLPDS
ncbi:MAG: RecX family transcriptional regulator [Bdellovibrionales bacterium]